MKPRVIDLRNKSVAQARKIVQRLRAYREENAIKRPLHFLLPVKGEAKKRQVMEQEKIKDKCPYCGSSLVQTETGIVCSSANVRDIIHDIETTRRRYGEQAELFLSKKANRFYDDYMLEGRDMRCGYVLGNEERRFRINNRLLRPGVDRKKIFGHGGNK